MQFISLLGKWNTPRLEAYKSTQLIPVLSVFIVFRMYLCLGRKTPKGFILGFSSLYFSPTKVKDDR